MGRSNRPPSLGRSAGARLTVIRPAGNSKWAVASAERTRSLLSLTTASGKPTMERLGSPAPRCTSTDTCGASIPYCARLRTVASKQPSLAAWAERCRLLLRLCLELANPRFQRFDLLTSTAQDGRFDCESVARHEVEARQP